jgi:hypothetical protein
MCDDVSLDEMMILERKILREYLISDLYIVFYVIVICELNVDEVEQGCVCFQVYFLFKFCEHFKDVYLMSI